MIPKIIWQTYKDPYNNLPEYALNVSSSWKHFNPDWEYIYMDDNEAAKFVLEYYGEEWHKIFVECPVGVMRGDLWRYLVVYQHGGLYADLDTICRTSINSWLPEQYDMIVCPENSDNFCQWTFLATPKHPILGNVLEVIKEGFKNPDYTNPHFVHALTGPSVWTKGIKQFLGVYDEPEQKSLVDDTSYYNNLEKAKQYKFYCFGDGGENHWRIFHWYAVQHIYASQNWNDGQYVRWINERANALPNNKYDLC